MNETPRAQREPEDMEPLDREPQGRELQNSEPERIGPYRVEQRLGAGGMGEVYAGYDDRLDRPVALKRIRTDTQRDTDRLRARFRREARAAARLRHTAIVQVFDWVETESSDWIVMEQVDGRSLYEVIGDGPLSPLRAAAIGRDVAAGLAVAHAAGIVHRDLKSANVMIETSGGVKILDFGVAKQIFRDGPDQPTTLSVDGALVGTVGIMSPEQATGGEVDHRTDLFALGILLYEMLIGDVPWRGANAVEVLTQICTHPHSDVRAQNPAVPTSLADLIDTLLEKEPARRPPSAEDVGLRLRAILGPAASSNDRHAEAPVPRCPATGLVTLDESASDMAAVFPSEIASPARETGPSQEKGPFQETTATSPGLAGNGTRKRGWAIFGVAILTVMGVVAWRFAPVGEAPEPQSSAAAPTAVDVEALSGHALYAFGMEKLARYDREGAIEEAIEAFQRFVAEDESSALAHAGLARAYWRNFRSHSRDPVWIERAVPVAERAVALDPFLAAGQISLGFAYASAGRAEEAQRAFDAVLELDAKNADAHYGYARLAQARGDTAEAERRYRLALAAAPDRWELHSSLGSLLYRAGRYDDAQAAYERVVTLAPDNLIGYRNLSGVYYQQGRLSDATAILQRALEVDPEATIYNNLGVLYFAQGLFAQAAAAFERGIEVAGGSNRFMTWANLGDAYRWAPGRLDDAQDAYLRAAQLIREQLAATPLDPTLQSNLALVLAKRGDADDGLATLAAISIDASLEANTLFLHTITYEIAGQRDRALEALGQALDRGYSIEDVKRDPELIALREDTRFHRMLLSR